MTVRLEGRDKLVSPVQPIKVKSPMEVRVAGRDKLVSPVQRVKVYLPTLVNP